VTHPAFPIVSCECTTWAAYGIRDRNGATGHHVECRGSDAPDRSPYRTAAPGPRSATTADARVEERASAARRLAAGHWVKQDGTPTSDGEECASFRDGSPSGRRER